MENLKNIGKEIKQTRLNNNWTMDYVSKEVGITRATLFAIENGKSNYSINTLLKLLKLLDLSISFDNKVIKKEKRYRATRVNLKQDKKINRFTIMCVEMYAKYKNDSSRTIYNLLKKKNIIEELYKDYDDLHSMGTEWLNSYIDSLIRKDN